ncbi:hypothetical protein N8654_04555, partial [Synechococcus sp. AH-601-B19]|nr:hypothetical protein [Synechococcus sp. AH-601-B19]
MVQKGHSLLTKAMKYLISNYNDKSQDTQMKAAKPIFKLRASKVGLKFNKNGAPRFIVDLDKFNWNSIKTSRKQERNPELFLTTTWKSHFGNSSPNAVIQIETNQGPQLFDSKIKEPRLKRNRNNLVIEIKDKSKWMALRRIEDEEIKNLNLSIEPRSSAATKIKARYHYGNGDYYDLEGDIKDYRYPKELNDYYKENPEALGNWSGSFAPGTTIAAEAIAKIVRYQDFSLSPSWENGYYEILSSETVESYTSSLEITKYYDAESGANIDLNSRPDYSSYSLGEEIATINNANQKISHIDFLNEFKLRTETGPFDDRVFLNPASTKTLYSNTFQIIGKLGALISDFDYEGNIVVWAEGTSSILGGSHEFTDSQIFSFNPETKLSRHISADIQPVDYFSYTAQDYLLSLDKSDSGFSLWKSPYRPSTNGTKIVFLYDPDFNTQPPVIEPFKGESILQYDLGDQNIRSASNEYIPSRFTELTDFGQGEYLDYNKPASNHRIPELISGNNLAFFTSDNDISTDVIVINELDSEEQHQFTAVGRDPTLIFSNQFESLHISNNTVAWIDDWGRAYSFNTDTNSLTTIEGSEEYGYDGGIDVFLANDRWLITDDIYGLDDDEIVVADLQKNIQFRLGTDDIFPTVIPDSLTGRYFEHSLNGTTLAGNILFGDSRDVDEDLVEWNTGESLDISWFDDNSYSMFQYNIDKKETKIIVPDQYLLPSGKLVPWGFSVSPFFSNDENVIAWQAYARDLDGFQLPEKEFLPGYESNAILAYNVDTGQLKKITDEIGDDLIDIEINERGDGIAIGRFTSQYLTVASDIWNDEFGEDIGYTEYL